MSEVFLYPYLSIPVVSMATAKQQFGWAIKKFNLNEAWNYSQGEGIRIAVLDTGCCLSHPDLKENLLPGVNFVEKGQPPEDRNDHGTHCAGIICASNNDIGMVGIAPKAKVHPVKVLDDKGSGTLENLLNGLKWAIKEKVDIINMSLGLATPPPFVQETIREAVENGIAVFVAAGNAGQTKQIFYPAAFPECIAIGSIDEDFKRSNFSCTGDALDFMAPGGDIFSTVKENWYGILSGTSMATPHAVGITALLLDFLKKKNLPKPKHGSIDFINMLVNYTTHTNIQEHVGNRVFEGYGIIDARKFSEWAATI